MWWRVNQEGKEMTGSCRSSTNRQIARARKAMLIDVASKCERGSVREMDIVTPCTRVFASVHVCTMRRALAAQKHRIESQAKSACSIQQCQTGPYPPLIGVCHLSTLESLREK